MRTIQTSITCLALLSTLWGCGPSWKVVRQASPNPFVSNRQWGIQPMAYEGLRVGRGAEAEFLSGKSPEQIASWEQDKAALDTEFRGALQSEAGVALVAPGGVPFTIAAQVTFIEPGFYAVVAQEATEVHLTLRLFDSRTNAVLDEVQFECTQSPGGTTIGGIAVTDVSVGARIRTCGKELGGDVADYLRARTGT